MGYQLVRLGGEIIGGLGAAPPGMPPAAMWTVYLATKDADATCAQVRELGGRTVMGPVPAGADGRLSLAVDPSGAPVGFWEGHHDVGVVLADEPATVCGFELRTPWPQRAGEFYGELFGLDASGTDDAPSRSLDLEGVPVARLTRIPPGEQPHWLPHFGVTDVADAVARACADGAVLTDAAPAPGAPTLLRDPWGARFALVPHTR